MSVPYYSPVRQISQPTSSYLIPLWVAYLFVFTVFSRELGLVSLGGIDYDFIGYTFFIFYFLYYVKNFFLSERILVIVILVFVLSSLSKLYFSFNFAPLWKQAIPIALIYLVCYDVLCRFDYKTLFNYYFQLSFWTAIIGFIQLILKVFFGIKLFTLYNDYFIDSIAAEPSHYAIIILPAVVYGLFYFKQNTVKTVCLLIALLFTTSMTAYVVLILVLLIVYRRLNYIFIIAPALYFVVTNFLLTYEKFNVRLLGFTNYFETNSFNRVYAGTSVSFLSNAEVAIESIKRNPLFGCGLGGHEEMYHEFYKNSSFKYVYLYGINAASGHSLLIRVFSETGLVGGFFYLFGLWKAMLFRADDYHRIISIACLSHFLGKALKLGGYFDYGTPFFAMILFFNFWDFHSKKS